MAGDVPCKDFDQRACFNRCLNKGQGRRCRRCSGDESRDRRRLLQGFEDIADRFGFAQDLNWKAGMKSALDAQHQLGASKTVDAEIALEPTGHGDVDRPFGPWAQLLHQLGDDGKESALARSSGRMPRQEIRFHRVPSWMTISSFASAPVDADQPPGCRVMRGRKKSWETKFATALACHSSQRPLRRPRCLRRNPIRKTRDPA